MGKVALARVDERLVHGQVMTNLSKSAGANAIFIVDDAVAKDDFMKMIFVNSGSRTGLKVKVFTVEDAVKYWQEKEFENYSVILLTKNIAVIHQLVISGVAVKELNLGGIAKRPATTAIIPQVAIDKPMADMLVDMHDHYQVDDIYCQATPSLKKVGLEETIKAFK